MYIAEYGCFALANFYNPTSSVQIFRDNTYGDVYSGNIVDKSRFHGAYATCPKLGHIYVERGRAYPSYGKSNIYIVVPQKFASGQRGVLKPLDEALSELPEQVDGLSTKVEDLISTMDLVNAAFEALSGRVAALEAKAESVTDNSNDNGE